jgi:hypothetical protein
MHELVDASWATAFSTSSNGGCAATCFDKLSMTLGHWDTRTLCPLIRMTPGYYDPDDVAMRMTLRRQ